MTMRNSKNSLYDKSDGHEYGKETLKDFEGIFNIFMPKSGSKFYDDKSDKTIPHQNSSSKLLGLTTAATNGGSGIKGSVVSCLHQPTSQTVVVKRYQLDEEKRNSNLFYNSQEHFNENVTLIMVGYFTTLELLRTYIAILRTSL